MINVEVYYGYYLGNAQMWDTTYVEIPSDTPEDKYEEVALSLVNFGSVDVAIAFSGLFCVDIDEVRDEEAYCPDCGGQMTWCETCQMYTATCCQEYGSCQCS